MKTLPHRGMGVEGGGQAELHEIRHTYQCQPHLVGCSQPIRVVGILPLPPARFHGANEPLAFLWPFDECLQLFGYRNAHHANREFTGDQVLANTIAFRRDILLYTELSDAISDSDIGRVCEVLKLLIFLFAGASKQNYTSILLDVYCLFKLEATKELKEAIWKQLAGQPDGGAGKCVPDDQLQEWHNRFQEDMVSKHGGSFDDPFFRETISPNVDFFQRLKEEMQEAFGLNCHRKTHTSPSVTNEIRMLMDMYRREQVHYFRAGRKMEHASKDLIDAGYTKLDRGKLAELLRTSTERAEVMAMPALVNNPSSASHIEAGPAALFHLHDHPAIPLSTSAFKTIRGGPRSPARPTADNKINSELARLLKTHFNSQDSFAVSTTALQDLLNPEEFSGFGAIIAHRDESRPDDELVTLQ
ncbi:hypothetical protein B0H14DRAFT_3154079 [Mycena olivaceomarginata]|nr:hypothetical protein B0H14DRAFT_3154079 [Mycena olivaceomarginata]